MLFLARPETEAINPGFDLAGPLAAVTSRYAILQSLSAGIALYRRLDLQRSLTALE